MMIIKAKRPGVSVDTGGSIWRLGSHKLNFHLVASDIRDPDERRPYVEAVAAYMRYYIRDGRPKQSTESSPRLPAL